MKKQDVQIGHIYSTNVSGRRVNVKVLSAVDDTSIGKRRTRFRVQRVDNGQTLPKTRDPLGLHPKIEEKKRRSAIAPALVAAAVTVSGCGGDVDVAEVTPPDDAGVDVTVACAQKDPAECADVGESP